LSGTRELLIEPLYQTGPDSSLLSIDRFLEAATEDAERATRPATIGELRRRLKGLDRPGSASWPAGSLLWFPSDTKEISVVYLQCGYRERRPGPVSSDHKEFLEY